MIAPPGKVVLNIDIRNRYYTKVLSSYLQLDPTYAPEEHTRTDALVAAVPKHMGSKPTRFWKRKDPVEQKSIDAAAMARERVDIMAPLYKMSDLDNIIQVGDIAILDYVVMDYSMVYIHDGKWYHTVSYDSIFGVVRNGEIIPINGNMFCEKEEKTVGSISKVLITPESLAMKTIKNKVATYQVIYSCSPIGGGQAIEPGSSVIAPDALRWANWNDRKYTIVNHTEAHAEVPSEV